jgi:hypothetical protein
MSNTLRSLFRRKLLALVAVPMLVAAAAAAPAPSEGAADVIAYKHTFYSNATYTQVVGYAFGYCDGDYIVWSGYETDYYRYKFMGQCP